MRHPIALLVLLTSTTCAGDGPRDSGWLGRAQQQIAAREYRASHNAKGLQAPNRAHALRTYFTPSGIEVHDRIAGTELLALELAGLGRGGEIAPVSRGELSSEGPRVEIRRPGLVEWYENSAAGLEQGFTLAERPGGDGALALELTVGGATATPRGDAVILASAGGRRLELGHLAVFDANERALPARFEVADATRLRLVVDDRDAAYPILIDPLLTAAPDAHVDGDQAHMHFGHSVAGAGDVNGDGYADVIVGAPSAAYVFESSASGFAGYDPTTADARLLSPDPLDEFGRSVAGAGDVNGDGYADVIVGAPDFDDGEGGDRFGAAFVFVGSESGVAHGSPATAAAHLGSIELNTNQNLGASVAGAGDLNGDGYADVVVGDPGFPFATYIAGGAFVFLGNGDGRASAARQQTPEGAVVPAWGGSQFGDGFRVSLDAHHPAGSGLVRGEFEACPVGTAFGDAGCTTGLSPGWTAVDGETPEVVLTHVFSGLDEGALYRWRARVLHAPASATQPGITVASAPAHGPWRRPGAQSVEADVRVIPEPAATASLVAGCALLAWLARRRARGSA